MTIIHLSLNDLPTFKTTSMFCCLETSTENALVRFPNVLERAKAGLRFTQYIGGGIPLSDAEVVPMQGAYLRAALMEFVGMEEVLPADLASAAPRAPVLTIWDTGNALLILLRELRHLNLHVINTSLEQDTRNAISYSLQPEPYHATFDIQIIPFADLKLLSTLRNSTKFESRELDAAINWFDQAQRAWGIADLVKAGFEQFAQRIIKNYVGVD